MLGIARYQYVPWLKSDMVRVLTVLALSVRSRGRRKTKAPRDGKRLSFGRRNPAYAKLIVEIDHADQFGSRLRGEEVRAVE